MNERSGEWRSARDTMVSGGTAVADAGAPWPGGDGGEERFSGRKGKPEAEVEAGGGGAAACIPSALSTAWLGLIFLM